MGLLSKRGIDVIDYTLLQKKGLMKKAPEVKKDYSVNSQGFVDLTSGNQNISNLAENASSSVNTNQSSDLFGFLDNIAQSSASQQNSNLDIQTSNQNINNGEVNSLKIKIDDLEYKLTNLIDKLGLIESKLQNFESKFIG